MRSFKQKLLTAAAWVVPALSAALPAVAGHNHAEVQSAGKQRSVELDLHETYAQATFSVPCPGCLGHADTGHEGDESLILSFKAHSSDKSCGTSNITLNGVYLPQEWNGDFASGSGSFARVPDIQENAWYHQHDLDLEWQTACLHDNETAKEDNTNDAAQVLTVTIKGIDGKLLNNPSGFTVSFKQLSPPELLRLQPTPNPSANSSSQAKAWSHPPASLRLGFAQEPSNHAGVPASIEDEVRELKLLEAKIQELQKEIKEKEKHIKSQLKQEAQNLKEELQDCDSLKCIVHTLAHKAHGAWKILYLRFRPIHHDGHEMGRPNEKDPYEQVWRAGNHNQASEATIVAAADSVSSTPPQPIQSRRPHPHPHPTEPPLVIVFQIIAGVLFCGCLVAVVRHCCSSPRTRTERAAAAEERANQAAYRRAACKHAWRKWWRRNWRDQDRIDDYEEKRSLIQEQESVLEEAMQEEIRQLREAHGVVRSIIQAEEGRGAYPPCRTAHMPAHIHCRCHNHSSSPEYSPVSSVVGSPYAPSSLADIPSRPLSRTNSLPDYRSETSTEPPAYEEDEDVSDVVVNGFRHYTSSTTSSAASSRWTPDSSVVDVSPRPSAETLRYPANGDEDEFAETTETRVGDVKN
ncbi:hypothetical protein BCR34DRAFT_484741 [Clohesyomyces aquaticus]|uniref:Uncharacterized protein n=1 Tax=Clohesyomyces aquaticus TaxID=1231657 RepID=A0A1Y1ZLC1_9PLEO|nr:hypothetical protein BCR34DRAFT_484741 [Clohesyomyces aquaticus]